jgi:hypothetical protein
MLPKFNRFSEPVPRFRTKSSRYGLNYHIINLEGADFRPGTNLDLHSYDLRLPCGTPNYQDPDSASPNVG